MVCALCYDSLLCYIVPIAAKIPGIKVISSYVPTIFMLFLVVMNLAQGNFKRITAKDVLFIVAFLFVIGVSYVVFPATREYFNEANMNGVFLGAIPCFFLGVDFDASKKAVRWITFGAYASILVRISSE